METSLDFETRIAAQAPKGRAERKVAALCAVAVLLVGILEAWLSRFAMGSDGISYLDVGDAFWRGDWHSALNGYWSPLYPVLLGAGSVVLKPEPYWQFPVVHLVNFVIFACTVLSFQYFLTGFLRDRSDSLPAWLWTMLAYVLFGWSTLRLIGVDLVSPDMCVAAFVFLATGALLRINMDPAPWRYALLGFILGIGYLAKSPLMPIAIVMLACSAFSVHSWKQRAQRIGLAGVFFLLAAGPLIFALSSAKGHFTFGDSWALNVAWYTNDVPRYYWHGEGGALHPARRVFDSPPAYEFNGPVKGTYPIWFDPAYWSTGIKPHLSVTGALHEIRLNGFVYYKLFFHLQAAVAGICLAMLLMFGIGRKKWLLLIPPVVALVMYAPVHVEERMLGAYVVLLWLGLFSSIRIVTSEQRRYAYSCLLGLAVLEAARLGLSVLGVASSHHLHEPNPQAQIVESLHEHGVLEGDKVAWIRPEQFTSVQNYWWARLAKVQIVAEIPSGYEKAFWQADSRTQHQLMSSLHAAGAKILVITGMPQMASPAGWTKIGRDGYFIRFLQDE
jgi:hypothetical protein